jgi:hypothetical protein
MDTGKLLLAPISRYPTVSHSGKYLVPVEFFHNEGTLFQNCCECGFSGANLIAATPFSNPNAMLFTTNSNT